LDLKFHFATILSPWIRRALIAGGFGTGITSSKTREIAAVVPNREDHSEIPSYDHDDVESANDLKKRRSGSESLDPEKAAYAPLISSDTPFFHVDLAGAVRAAESGLNRISEKQ